MNTKEITDTYELAVYPKRDIVLVRGKGSRLYDDKGREYIDCASNIGVSNIGHGNEAVAKAIYEQYLKLGNCYSMLYNPVRAELAQRLVNTAPKGLNRVFFCNSGTEAIEGALKFARATTGRKEFIAAVRGFHGRTMGALAATWGPEYQKPFMPMLEGLKHVPYNDYEKLNQAVDDNVAAILLETVQGEGGIRVGDKEYFQKVRMLCDSKDMLLIIDEVQTGFGRTGTMFACEQFVTPDILCLAKALAGGIPMGAVLCTDRISVPVKSHGSTFGGNPTACAAALASIEVIEKEGLVERAKTLGAYFLEQLKSIKSRKIREVRGLGLMLGIELKEKAGQYVQQIMEKGVIVLLSGVNVIRLLPPLVISREEIDSVIIVLREVFED
ncbi:MAG: aspartate aminotransferase family protein [Deltaproteobacteria bacterium]|nr:aspartate aminotransferase family protein [Deltaproteobacteria bacterium]